MPIGNVALDQSIRLEFELRSASGLRSPAAPALRTRLIVEDGPSWLCKALGAVRMQLGSLFILITHRV
jgi:hypothetical protein